MKPRIKSIIWIIRKQKTTNWNNKKKKESKKKKNKESISSLWYNFKRSNIHLIEAPEKEEKEQDIGNLSEKTVEENFSNLVKQINMQIQGVRRVPVMMDAEAHYKAHQY